MKNYLHETVAFDGDPFQLLKAMSREPYCFLLDSSLSGRNGGRYSFLGCDPFDVYQHKAHADLDRLRRAFQPYRFQSRVQNFLPGAIVGYLGYDHGLFQERIKRQSVDDLKLPDCLFGFYDAVMTIDHYTRRLHFASTGFPETSVSRRAKRARQRLNQMKQRVAHVIKSPSKISESRSTDRQGKRRVSIRQNFTPAQYRRTVQRALDYIASGDIYQVNVSQRFEYINQSRPVKPVTIYQGLREISPSQFGAYFDAGPFQIISSSPERYLRLQGRRLSTQPMKGTRPRGQSPAEDRRLRDELLRSKKEIAELLMITDLERNDLGRVCEYGSVEVTDMRTIEEYATVFQATSTVEGRVRKQYDMFDVLTACFPGGSITGCPKIRAMEIIEELEPHRRGIYTGALGYIGFNGGMDFNILIRTILAQKNKYYYQVGGGIVADSTPQREYDETLVKARGIEACFQYLFETE